MVLGIQTRVAHVQGPTYCPVILIPVLIFMSLFQRLSHPAFVWKSDPHFYFCRRQSVTNPPTSQRMRVYEKWSSGLCLKKDWIEDEV